MLQILYGNDRANYRLIAKSSEMSEREEQSLSRYRRYQLIRDPSSYTAKKNFPKSLTYCCNGDTVFLCLNGQMENLQTPSAYFHGLSWKAGKDFFLEKFDRVFGIEFLDGQGISECAGNVPAEIPIQTFTAKRKIDSSKLYEALVDFHIMETEGKCSQWILDVQGDLYNVRCKEVLQSFFRYLPWQVRKYCGFCTYCGEDQTLEKEIRIRIYDRTQLSELEGYFDWESPARARSQSETEVYVDFLQNASIDEKKQFETVLEDFFPANSVTARQALETYLITCVWTKLPLEQAFPKWKNFLLRNRTKKDLLYRCLEKQMQERLPSEAFMSLLLKDLESSGVLYSEISANDRLKTTFELAEYLSWIELDMEKLGFWELATISRRAEQTDTNEEALILSEIDRVERMTPWGIKRQKVQEHLLDILRHRTVGTVGASIIANTEKEALAQKAQCKDKIPDNEIFQERRQELLQEMRKLYKLKTTSILKRLTEIYEMAVTSDLEEAFFNGWKELFSAKAETLQEIQSLDNEEYKAWMEFLDYGRTRLLPQEESEVSAWLQEKHERFQKYCELGNLKIKNRTELTNFYQAWYSRKELEGVIRNEEVKQIYIVELADGQRYRLSQNRLARLIEYLLIRQYEQEALAIISENGYTLLRSLLRSGLLTPIHFFGLITSRFDSNVKIEILDYYIANDFIDTAMQEVRNAMQKIKRTEPDFYEYSRRRYRAKDSVFIQTAFDVHEKKWTFFSKGK